MALLTLLVIFAATMAVVPAIMSPNELISTKVVEGPDIGYNIYFNMQPAGDPGGGGWPM